MHVCEHCGGRAILGLAHIHNLTIHLCLTCTNKVLKARAKREARKAKQREGFGDFVYPNPVSQAA